MKALDVIGHCHEGVMQLVRKVLPDLWSDRTLGYKVQHGFGAIIESLTALNNSPPLNQLSTTLTKCLLRPTTNMFWLGVSPSPAPR